MHVIILLSAFLLLAVGIVSAAADEQAATIPPERAYDDGHCFSLEVKMLYQAANVGNSLEDMQKYRIAADAYDRLDALGQSC